jgi:AraC-like DNA-binding protein
MISRAARTVAVPVSLHHISNWPLHTEGGCKACRFVHDLPEGGDACKGHRLKASNLALQSGVPVTFSCHLGFSCVSLPALPGEDYVLTFGPYVPEDASLGIEKEVGETLVQLTGINAFHEELPFDLSDLRRAPSESIAAAAEWLVEGIAQFYATYEGDDQDEPIPVHREESVSTEGIKKQPVLSEKKGEELRLQIAAAYLLFGKTRVVRAVLEDCLEEIGTNPRTRQGRLIECITHILDHLHYCGADIENCRQRFPAFVAAIQELDEEHDLLRRADRFFRSFSAGKLQESYGPAFSTMLDRLYNDHMEELQLRDFALHSGVNPATLTRRLERVTGVKFAELLGRIRVIHAQRFLRRSRQSATKIALRVGIQDQSNFTKLFKQYTGMTPGEYQQKYTLRL